MQISKKELWEKAKGYCQICGRKISIEYMERCHIIPKVREGSDSKDNLYCGCLQCNRLQGENILEELGWVLYTSKNIKKAPRYGEEFQPEPLDELIVRNRAWKATSKRFSRARNQHFAAVKEGLPTELLETMKSQYEDYKKLRDGYAKEMGKAWAGIYPKLDKIVLPQLVGISRGLTSQIMSLADYSRSISSIKNYSGIAPIYDGHWAKRRKGQKCKHNMLAKSLLVKKVGTQIRKANGLSEETTKTCELMEARKQYNLKRGFPKGKAEFDAGAYTATQFLIKLIKCCLDDLSFSQPTWEGSPDLSWCQEIVEEYNKE